MKAFPNEGFNGWGSPEEGMDLRDYFAAKAMQAILSRTDTPLNFDAITLSKPAYQVADSMMKAREL